MYLLGILFLHAATAALPVLPDPPTLPHSVAAAHQYSKVHTHIHNATTTSVLTKAKKNSEKVKKDMLKTTSMVFPPPPQLPPYDYSILKKQKADQKQKFYDALNQQTQKSQKKKEAVLLNLEKSVQVELPPKPATLIDSKTAHQDSEARAIILRLTTDSAPVVDKNDDQEVKRNKAKIDTIVPPPPELPPFDYSNLRKQKSDQNPKFGSTKQAAEKSKKKKEATILDLEKSVKVKISLIPATRHNFVTAPQESDISANILGVASDSTPADKKDNEEVKHNIIKITTVYKPPPPEPIPFDYHSSIRKQKAEHNLKSEHSAQQEVMRLKEEKERVNLDLKKPDKVKETPNPATDSIATDATVVDKKDNEETKMTVGKITLDVIPPPPELPLFDSSILQKHKSEQKQKSDNYLKQKVEKSKKDKEVLIIKKPVKVQVEEPKLIEESKLVGDSKPMVEFDPVEESKPVEGSKPKKELKKEPVKHSEDIPLTSKWTVPTFAPYLSKLVSNYPPLPSLGLNWPLQRPSKSRPPRIIYP